MINATAILTTDIDSTQVVRKIADITQKLSTIAAQKIAPIFDFEEAKRSVDQVWGRLKNIADMRIAPKIEVASVNASAPAIASNLDAEFSKALSVSQKLSSDLSGIFANLESKIQAGIKGNKTSQIENDLNRIAASTRNTRQSIITDFAELISKGKALQAVSPEIFSSTDKAFSALQENLANKAGGKVLFRDFVGKVPVSEIRNAIAEYEKALTGAASSFGNILGKPVSASTSAIPQTINTLRTQIEQAAQTRPVEIAVVPQAKVEPGTLARSLDSLSTQVKTWSSTEFVQRFEWSQGARAIRAEAEAAFSRESIGRKIFNTIFSDSTTAGYLGYWVGKIVETLSGLAKSLSVNVLNIPSIVAGWIGKVGGDKFSSAMNALKQNITRFIAPIQATIVGVFSIFQVIFNKYTVSTALALYSYSNKLFIKAFASIFSIVSSLAKSLYNKISSIFSSIFSGVLGGIGRGGSSGVSFSQIFGLAGIGTTIKLAGDLQEAILGVATLSQQSGASLNFVSRSVISLSNEFGKSAIDVAGALYDITSASFKGAEGFQLLRSTLQAATAGMTTAKIAGTAISRMLRAWNEPASSAAMASDVLFTVVKRGIMTFEELAQQVTRVSALASTTGVSMQELGAVIAYLTRNGQTMEQAITGIQGILKSLIAPAEEAREEANRLGLAWDETALKQKGFIKLLQDASPIIASNKGAFKKLVGEIYAVNSALSISQNPQELTADINAMFERGAAAEAAAQVALGFNYQIQKFWENFINILRNIGQIMLPMIQPVLERVVEFTEKISSFANQNFSGFWSNLAQIASNLGTIAINAFGSLFNYVLAKINESKKIILAGLVGTLTGVSIFVYDLLMKYGKQIGQAVWGGMKYLAIETWEAIKALFFVAGQYLEEQFGILYTGIKNLMFLVALPFIAMYELVGKIARAVTWIIKLFKDIEEIEPEKIAKDQAKIIEKFDVQTKLDEFGKNFQKGFNKVYDYVDSATLDNGLKTKISESFSTLGNEIVASGKGIFDQSSAALADQADSIRQVLDSLTAQHKKEIAANQTDRAAITQKFIDKQKAQLEQIASQLRTNEMDEALKAQQKLYIDLAKARRDGNAKLQTIIIESIKNNELQILKLDKLAQKNVAAAVNPQINMYDTLKNKALSLVEAGKKLGDGLGNLNTVLDDIFGKNVDRIAKQYGVGQDIADARELARDVIEAKAAGFDAQQISTIVTRGLMQKSSALTNILSAFQKYQKVLSTEDVAKMGLSEQIVRLLDQAQALGLDAVGRRALLQNAITEEAFKNLDEQLSGDKTVKFVEQANKHFEGIAEERKLQERFNVAQLRVSELTKEAVTRNQKLKQTVEELEKKIVEIEQIQGKQNQVLIQAP